MGINDHEEHFADAVLTQVSLERMDEVFGVADFSKVEDVGVAAKRGETEASDQVEDVNMSKV